MASLLVLLLNAAALCSARTAAESEPALSPQLRGRVAAGASSVADVVEAAARRLETRHASAHLRYSMPVTSPTSWYNQVTPTDTAEVTFFATNSNGFGYMGLQQAGPSGPWREGKAIFSIWDGGCPGVNDESACPEDQRAVITTCGEIARCGRFGNEGTGVQSTIRFDQWEVGRVYGFMLTAQQVGSGKVEYAGYVHAEELNGWRLLSKVQVNVGLKSWYIHSPASFVEQWKAIAKEQERTGLFGPSFAQSSEQGGWAQVQSASFFSEAKGDEDPSRVGARVDTSGSRWEMGLGGDNARSSYYSADLTVVVSGVPGAVQAFASLRSAGQLPGGCEGDTCFRMKVSGFFSDVFRTKQYSPITIAVFLFVICCLCPTIGYYCLLPRYGHRIRRLRHKAGQPVAPMEAGIAVVQEAIDRSVEVVHRVTGAPPAPADGAQDATPAAGPPAAGGPAARARSLSAGLAGRFGLAAGPDQRAEQGLRPQRGRSPTRAEGHPAGMPRRPLSR